MILTENEYEISKNNLAKMKRTLENTIVNVNEMNLTAEAGDPVMRQAHDHVAAQELMVESLQQEVDDFESKVLLNENMV